MKYVCDKVLGSLLVLLFLICPTAWAAAVHPAVVRVVVSEGSGAFSCGSGTLVAASGRTGLVLTNWHVVRDRNGPVEVVFPGGFRSAARVLRTDRDWDLAALLVWRPDVDPVPIATQAPRKGDFLTIAGYGKGRYRYATGKCVSYLSPGGDMPFEMVELTAGARQGDSGGPIFNQRGEMAGVLFGSAFGKTSGSHSLRVRQFLSSIDPQLADGRLAPQPNTPQAQQYAQNVQPGPRIASEYPTTQPNHSPASSAPGNRYQAAWVPPDSRSGGNARPTVTSTVSASTTQQAPQWQAARPTSKPEGVGGKAAASPESVAVSEKSGGPKGPDSAEGAPSESFISSLSQATLWDHVKNVLCLIGGVAIFFQLAKFLNPDDSRGKPKKAGK
ncbi:MAG: serine protease [Planctomycetia bacterium]|jgi:hypothetical protein